MKRNAFTIFEVLLSTVVIGFIAMLLTSSLVTSKNTETLKAALNKNTTFLNQIYQAIPMLQIQGKIAPGTITANRFMQAVALTSKCIDLKPNGTQIINNRKFGTYFYDNPTQNRLTSDGNINENQFSLFCLNNNTGQWSGNTIILKNNVIIINNNAGNIVLDVNGRKSPNVVGKDIYIFTVNDTRLELQQ